MIIRLSLSSNYVKHWGLWEAVRELYQNALDQRDLTDCNLISEYDKINDDNYLTIGTDQGKLEKSTLLLGEGNKNKLRGQFGEGYKLALLVLCRLGYEIAIQNEEELWRPSISYSEEFGCDVLSISILDYSDNKDKGVRFKIRGISITDWKIIEGKIRLNDHEDIILKQPSEKGNIYVGGLFVQNAKNFEFGYSLKTMPLDRDRGLIGDFNLSYKTSQLWVNEDGCFELIKKKIPDVEYCEAHGEAAFTKNIYSRFVSSYGYNAIPVSTQEEIEEATKAGMIWTLVPEQLKTILRKVKKFIIPTDQGPIERLRRFRKKYCYSDEMRDELNQIITKLEGKVTD